MATINENERRQRPRRHFFLVATLHNTAQFNLTLNDMPANGNLVVANF